VFFIACLLLFLSQAALLLSPFSGPILAALAVSILCFPMHRWIVRRLSRSSPSMRACLSTLAVFLFIVVPFTLMFAAVLSEGLSVLPEVKSHALRAIQWLREVKSGQVSLNDHLPAWLVQRLTLDPVRIEEKVLVITQRMTSVLAAAAAILAGEILTFILNLFLFLFLLFFFFRDGPDWFEFWNDALPFSTELKKRLHEKAVAVVSGILRGSLLTGLIQGLFLMIGYLIVDAQAAVLLGMVTAFASLIPGIGIGLVWVPVGGYFFVKGIVWKGVLIAVFGVIGSFLDNILRPFLSGSKARIPFFWFTLGLLGGLQIYGLKGLLLGPLVFALLPILLDIYRHHILKSKV
jgi:predicted PurR-regulated permease PerM